MHLHGCDPRTEHLLPRWSEPGAAAADGEGKNFPGAPEDRENLPIPTLPSAPIQASWGLDLAMQIVQSWWITRLPFTWIF